MHQSQPPFPQSRVGESLDWSSPGLLAELGLPPEELIRDGVATAKRNIQIIATERRPVFSAAPWPWLRNPPMRFEIVTVHVDRLAMDQRLCALATRHGVEFVEDRVVALEARGDRICSLATQSGRRITARWFIDASGRSTRFLARKFRLAKTDYGRTKVCLWRHFETAIHNEGTTFYVDSSQDDYLSWIWEIPITPQKASVGCIMSAEYVGRQRQLGRSVQEILWERLGRFDRFHELLATQATARLNALSYRSYVYHRPCGANWLMMGEAATLVDPLTANGVTAALRHAGEGARFILESWKRGELTRRQKAVYTANLTGMGHFFNHSIEASIYDWPMRQGLGLIRAVNIYTAFAYTMNAVYSRIKADNRRRPRGRLV